MKLLVLSGGNHPYEESTPVLKEFLKEAGHEVTVTEDTEHPGYVLKTIRDRNFRVAESADRARLTCPASARSLILKSRHIIYYHTVTVYGGGEIGDNIT